MITWLQQEAPEQGRVELESCFNLVNGVVRIRKQVQQPRPALFQVGDNLESLGVVSEHLHLEHLRPRGLEGVAVEPMRHCERLNFNG